MKNATSTDTAKNPKFGKFEERVARRIAAYLRKSETRTPKKWEVIYIDYKNDPSPTIARLGNGRLVDRSGQTDRRAFKNLLALGYVKHSPNGHCWLTKAGAKKLDLKTGAR